MILSVSRRRRIRLLFRSLILIGGIVLIAGLVTGPARAQDQGDILRYTATLFAAGGSGDNLPFWLSANQYGTIDPRSANGGLRFSAYRPFSRQEGIDYALGVDLLGRVSHHATVYAPRLYGRLRYGGLQLTVGRREQVIGRVDTSLSLGSVTWSRNATPPPKVSLSSDGYLAVPGTGGFLAGKGYFAHGWLGQDRFVEGAFLHEKYLYLRLLPADVPVNGHAGLVHHATWGGTSPLAGHQAAGFDDWLDVVLGRRNAGEGTPGAPAAQANHMAAYDFSVSLDFGDGRGLVYRQFYHEDTPSLLFRNPWDGSWGLGYRRNEPTALVNAILWEHVRMTRQNAKFSEGEERGADVYYGHSLYRSGWTYEGRTLGMPLLIPASRTPGLRDDLPGIGNSIVVAHHVGIEGALGRRHSYQLLGTYSRNYGAQGVCEPTDDSICGARTDRRTPRRDQYSFRVEVRGPILDQHNLGFRTALAFDTGSFYEDRLGVSVALSWRSGAKW